MQRKVFCVEAHLVKNFAYANKTSRGGRGQMIHIGEAGAEDTPGGEFYDAVVGYRQSQYDVVEKQGRNPRGFGELDECW